MISLKMEEVASKSAAIMRITEVKVRVAWNEQVCSDDDHDVEGNEEDGR